MEERLQGIDGLRHGILQRIGESFCSLAVGDVERVPLAPPSDLEVGASRLRLDEPIEAHLGAPKEPREAEISARGKET